MSMKQFYRLQHLGMRNNLAEKEMQEKSKFIEKKLNSLHEFNRAKTILFYVGIKSEVRTKSMIENALSIGKIIAIPLNKSKNHGTCISRLYSLDDLEIIKLGLLEPKEDKFEEISLNEIDLAILPGIAFDTQGHRLGYGGGFFDRLLPYLRKNTPLIGLAYEINISEKIPYESHDRKVNKIITEDRIIEVN